MLMLVMASVSVLLMLVMMSRFFPPLLRIDSRQQDPMENLSKLVKGQGRVHQKASGGEPTRDVRGGLLFRGAGRGGAKVKIHGAGRGGAGRR